VQRKLPLHLSGIEWPALTRAKQAPEVIGEGPEHSERHVPLVDQLIERLQRSSELAPSDRVRQLVERARAQVAGHCGDVLRTDLLTIADEEADLVELHREAIQIGPDEFDQRGAGPAADTLPHARDPGLDPASKLRRAVGALALAQLPDLPDLPHPLLTPVDALGLEHQTGRRDRVREVVRELAFDEFRCPAVPHSPNEHQARWRHDGQRARSQQNFGGVHARGREVEAVFVEVARPSLENPLSKLRECGIAERGLRSDQQHHEGVRRLSTG
jgi:hypothetical protein